MIAGRSNRWATNSVSATSLLRSAHTSSGGNIAAALSLLHSWSHDHWRAAPSASLNVMRSVVNASSASSAADLSSALRRRCNAVRHARN